MRRIVLVLVLGGAAAGLASGAGAAEPRGAEGAKADAALPLKEVVLYTSGVGYFERDGHVEGDARVDLPFKADDINDLLKSLVVQDFDGGQVSTVSYGSRDPVARALKSFGIDLTASPGLGALLTQVRGERVEVTTPTVITGTVLGVETKKRPVGDDKEKVVEVEYLNLLTSDGLRSIALDQVQRVKLLNERLDAELRQALGVLAGSHDTQKKTVSVRFEGKGKRRVRVAYIRETPVWKTSYRLVLGEEDGPFLQGWAIVENTTDDDWDGVKLSLVSGRPISFVMDLYQPLYATRPVVVPELFASLHPQVYGDAVVTYNGAPELSTAAPAPAAAPAPGMAFRAPLARSRMAGAVPMADQFGAGAAEARLDLNRGVAAAAQGLQAGELFQYAIKAPVTLARQKSALLPILGEKVEAKKVSIYNEAAQPKHPLHGVRLKNTTALALMQGPITVFDDGAYAGDARIEDLAPGQDRLISYALDQKVEVEPQAQGGRRDLVSVKLRRGTLIATRKSIESKLYLIRDRDKKPREVLVEHPFRDGWTLAEPSEPAERTRAFYRFAVKVAPDQTARLLVREEQQQDEAVGLADLGPDQIVLFLQAREVSDKVKDALRKVVQLRDRLQQTRSERARLEQRIAEINQEQSRIRENLARLAPNSELANRYVKKLDQQETELEELRQKIEKLKDTEAQQQRELSEYLLGLEID